MHNFSSDRRKSAQKARALAEIRQDIGALSEKIIRALAERKKYGLSYAMYAGSSNDAVLALYLDILNIICYESSGATMTPEIRALDKKAMSLIQKRIALGREALALKRNSGMPLRDYAREKELILRAGIIAEECGMDPKIGARIIRRIIRKTMDAEAAEFMVYRRPSARLP